MKKAIILIITAIFLITLFCGAVTASTSGDENSHEYAQGEQPDPEDIPGMDRAEDRTRNKDS